MEIDYGWSTPPQAIKDEYRKTCLELANDDSLFKDFRRNPGYSTILEGFDVSVANGALVEIRRLGKEDDFIARFQDLAKNDAVGNPELLQLPEIGRMAPNTVRYASVAYEIKDFAPHAKRIVEIGGGYGGMARMLSEFYDYDEYTIVDLPEALELAKKYLSNFPCFSKMIFLTPDQVKKSGDYDLFIADASLSECDAKTQEKYINSYAIHSDNIFVLYNTLHLHSAQAAFISTISGLTKYSFRFKKVLKDDGREWDSLVKIKAKRA